jgi:hypothetical protein
MLSLMPMRMFIISEIEGVAMNRDTLRRRESEYLDCAQNAIWEQALDGDYEAIEMFLKISDRRVKLWGLAEEQDPAPHEWIIHIEREAVMSGQPALPILKD